MTVTGRPRTMTASLVLSAWLLAAFAGAASADWSLDPERSHLAFVSIKAKDTAEVNTFKEMSGTVDEEGRVEIALRLDSVETLIPIRNERMRELLFETADYKEARLTAKIDGALLADMTPGEIATTAAEGILSLHGERQPMILTLQVAKVADDTLMVASVKPVIVEVAKFGLTSGIERLREIAGLESISHAVPVSFVVTFVDAPAP
ncbi:polyisoprenoid-binding protein [Thiococcus pfennigii]|nr:polyisoprenoid-binding protein [Thiococcus pfennigii]